MLVLTGRLVRALAAFAFPYALDPALVVADWLGMAICFCHYLDMSLKVPSLRADQSFLRDFPHCCHFARLGRMGSGVLGWLRAMIAALWLCGDVGNLADQSVRVLLDQGPTTVQTELSSALASYAFGVPKGIRPLCFEKIFKAAFRQLVRPCSGSLRWNLKCYNPEQAVQYG